MQFFLSLFGLLQNGEYKAKGQISTPKTTPSQQQCHEHLQHSTYGLPTSIDLMFC